MPKKPKKLKRLLDKTAPLTAKLEPLLLDEARGIAKMPRWGQSELRDESKELDQDSFTLDKIDFTKYN